MAFINVNSIAKLRSLTFESFSLNGADNSHVITADPAPNLPEVRFAVDQWLDLDYDGRIDIDDGEHRWPTSYVRGTVPEVTLEFKIEGDTSANVHVRGKGVVDFVEVGTSYSGADGTKKITLIGDLDSGKGRFVNTIRYLKDNQFTWEYRIGDTGNWKLLGNTYNDIYVTLGAPQIDPVYHTVIHIGTVQADGETTENQAMKKIWNYFSGRSVQSVDEKNSLGRRPSAPLLYWGDWHRVSATLTTTSILTDHDGRCGSWARFLLDVLKAQGIDPGKPAAISSVPLVASNKVYLLITPIDGADKRLVINNWWKTAGPQLLPGETAKIKFASSADPTGHDATQSKYDLDPSTELDDFQGLRGQNNPNPKSTFLDHAIVRLYIDGTWKWLDPSYGQEYEGATDELKKNDFESKALFGIGTLYGDDVSGRGFDVKRQDPNKREIIITPKDENEG